MKILELIAHWAFALFVAMITYIVSFILCALLTGKTIGLQNVAGAPPLDFHPSLLFNMAAYGTIFAPFMFASYCGTVSAPNAQRRIASILIPAFVFLAINLADYLWGQHYSFNIGWLLKTGTSCAVVGAFLYFRCTRISKHIGK